MRRAEEFEEFEQLRPLLFSIGYRILGSVGEAEDAVQETWLRYQASPAQPTSAKAFLSAVVTRISINVLRSARSRREEYAGPWFPGPRRRARAWHAQERKDMKLTVIGGTGLIGSQVVQKLTAAGHQAVPAALSTGLDLITGKGLDQALEGAEVVVNVANSPTFDEASVGFFRTSMNNLLAAGERAGAGHQVILSIVGVDQVPQLDYYRAKTLQEDLLRQGPTPYSIVRPTQFFEFINTVVTGTSDDTTVRLPSTRLQPIAAANVADAVVEVSTGPPLRGIRNFAGPDVFPLDELGRLTLAVQHDNRTVITDDNAGVFAGITGDVLTAGPDAHLAPTHYQDWIQTPR